MYHDKLNLKFWDGLELKQEVATKLLEIGYKWAEFAKIPQESIRDITVSYTHLTLPTILLV